MATYSKYPYNATNKLQKVSGLEYWEGVEKDNLVLELNSELINLLDKLKVGIIIRKHLQSSIKKTVAYYCPETDNIYVFIDTVPFSGHNLETILLHELVHAMQANFKLEGELLQVAQSFDHYDQMVFLVDKLYKGKTYSPLGEYVAWTLQSEKDTVLWYVKQYLIR